MTEPLLPKEIRRLGEKALRIVWGDGHQSDYPNVHLRDNCPCAYCCEAPRKQRLPVMGAQGGALYPERIGVVGRYAVSIQWSDGHDSGIYSYRTLRELCPCETCRPAAPRTSEITP